MPRASALPLFSVHQESKSLVLEALRLSQDEGFCLGVKLVRGAYMDKERTLAEKEGCPDPVHTSWEDTNERWTNSPMSSEAHRLSLFCLCVQLQRLSQHHAGRHFPDS